METEEKKVPRCFNCPQPAEYAETETHQKHCSHPICEIMAKKAKANQDTKRKT